MCPSGWEGVEESNVANTAASGMNINLKAGDSCKGIFIGEPASQDIYYDPNEKTYKLFNHKIHPAGDRGWRVWIQFYDVATDCYRILVGGKALHKMLKYVLGKNGFVFSQGGWQDDADRELFERTVYEITRQGAKADTVFLPEKAEVLETALVPSEDFNLKDFITEDLGGVTSSDLPF